MKQIVILVVAASMLCSCSSVNADDPKSLAAQARDNAKMAEKYHKLANDAKEKQAVLQGFIASWIDQCKIKGNVLQMGQDGDPYCGTAPAAQTAQSPVAQPSQTQSTNTPKSPITPAKK